MKNIIKKIGDKVLVALYNFDRGYEYDGKSVRMAFDMDIFSHEVSVDVKVRLFGATDVEVIFGNDDYQNLEPAVLEYVENNFNDADWYNSAVGHFESEYGIDYNRCA